MAILIFIIGAYLGFKISQINWHSHFRYKANTGVTVRINSQEYLISTQNHSI